MPYTLSDLGQGKLGPGTHSAEEVAAAGGSTPTLRPWPGSTSAPSTRPCFPPGTLAMLGAQPQYVTVGQPCPANYTESPQPTAPYGGKEGTGTGNTTSRTGTFIGTPTGLVGTGGSVVHGGGLPGTSGGGVKQPGAGAGYPEGYPGAYPGTYPPDMYGGEAAGPSWISQYKWWLLGGAGLVLAGIVAIVMVRKQPAPPAGYIPIYEEDD